MNPSTIEEDRQFAFDSLQNEVVVDRSVIDLSPYIDAPVVVKKEYNLVEVHVADKKKEKKEEEEEEQEEGGVGEELDHEEEEEQEEGEELDHEEEEQEGLHVDPFEYNGQTYYKDAEGNVYQEDEEGDVDDTPIGRWLEAKQKVKFYPIA